MTVGMISATSLVDQQLAAMTNSGVSMETLIIARDIVDTGNKSAAVMRSSAQLRELRDAEQEQVNLMQKLGAYAKIHSHDGKISTHNFVVHFRNFLNENPELKEKHPELDGFDKPQGSSLGQKASKLNRSIISQAEFTMDPETGAIEKRNVGRILPESAKHDFGVDLFATYAEKHKANISKIDSTTQLKTMELQDLVQRKQRLMTLAGNISDARHRGADAIIKNIRA